MKREAPIAALFWLLFGVLGILGILGAMTIGPILIPLALVALVVALLTTKSVRLISTALGGVAVVLLILGVLNLGTTPCPPVAQLSTANRCDGWPPVPFLIGGVVAGLVGLASWRSNRHPPEGKGGLA